MTFRLLQTLSVHLQQNILASLEADISPHLEPDVSNYAEGRMRAWIPFQAPLSDKQDWQLGVSHDRIWSWILRTCEAFDFKADIALMSKGGEIQRHRDASYADYRAIGINFGHCIWHQEHLYPEYKWSPNTPSSGEVETTELVGGEVFEFNCKNPHWVSEVEDTRWGINVWHVNDKARNKFVEQTNGV